MYSDKDSHLTCNVLLHYLVKFEGIQMLIGQHTQYIHQHLLCSSLYYTLLPVICKKYLFLFYHFNEIYIESHVYASATTK